MWYFLVIIFLSGGGPTAVTMPEPYSGLANCKRAAEWAMQNYEGHSTRSLEFTCVPQQGHPPVAFFPDLPEVTEE